MLVGDKRFWSIEPQSIQDSVQAVRKWTDLKFIDTANYGITACGLWSRMRIDTANYGSTACGPWSRMRIK